MFLYTVEHLFEVIIENVSGLKLLDNMIWGEADCFIQYHFPAQIASAGRVGGATVVCGMLFLPLLQMVIANNNFVTLVTHVFELNLNPLYVEPFYINLTYKCTRACCNFVKC